MRVLVLGGRGFIGKALVKLLLAKRVSFDVLSRTTFEERSDESCSDFSVVKGDLLSTSFDPERLVQGYDIIFNCSGELKDESLMYPLHVEALQKMVQACKTIARKHQYCIHWVQLSSVGAYGPSLPSANVQRIVAEDTTTNPTGQYEVTKTLADEYIIDSADFFFSYSILRPSNVYGSEMPNNSIRQMAAMIKKGLFFYIGKQSSLSNYIHVDDVADALFLCGFDVRAKNQTFNLSNDCALNCVVNALADHLYVSHPSIHVNELFIRFAVGVCSFIPGFPLTQSRVDALVSRTSYSTEKIKSVLGYSPLRDVKDTIQEVFK